MFFPGETFFKEKGFPEPLPKTFSKNVLTKFLQTFYKSAPYFILSFSGKFLGWGLGKPFSQKGFPQE